MLIALLLALVVAGVLVFAATKPDTLRVVRSLRIAAAPQRIEPLVADFHRWAAWSPYEKLDPAMQKTFSGAPAGVGAVYEWNGAGKAGAGRMEITGATPVQVTIKLDFIKPFEGHNVAEFSFVPRPGVLCPEADAGIHGHGPHDRPGLRGQTRQSQKRGRTGAVAGAGHRCGVSRPAPRPPARGWPRR